MSWRQQLRVSRGGSGFGLCIVNRPVNCNNPPFGGILYTAPCSRVLHEKPTRPQLVKKLPAFCGTRRFITAFTRARHLSLFWARSIQSMPFHPTYWRFISILYSYLCLCLPSGIFSSGLLTQILCVPLVVPVRATCTTHALGSYDRASFAKYEERRPTRCNN